MRRRRIAPGSDVEVDLWTRLANHLRYFAHPGPALDGVALILSVSAANLRTRAMRQSRQSRPVAYRRRA